MPVGYSGSPAKRFFGCCDGAMEEAHSVLASAAANMPALSMPPFRLLSFTVADALFRPGATAGVETIANIVASRNVYESATSEHRMFGGYLSEKLREIYDEVDSVMDTNLRLPLTCAQVRLVTHKLKLLIPELKGLLEQAGSVTNRQASSMLSIAGGGDGFELQRSTADACRTENEACMRGQALDMREFAQQARDHAARLEEQANALRPQLNATKFVHLGGDDRNWGHIPDQAARNTAAAKIASLECDARIYRGEAIRLDTAASNLDDDIRYAGNIFDTDCEECISCDTYFAGEFAQLAADIQQLAGRFQAIRESFCPTAGVVDFRTFAGSASMEGKDQIIIDAMVASIMNGNLCWTAIEHLAGLEYIHWTPAIETALGAAILLLDAAGMERLLLLISYQVGDVHPPQHNAMHMPHAWTEWRFDAEKLAGIIRGVDRLAAARWIEQFMVHHLTEGDVNSLVWQLLTPHLDAGHSFSESRSLAYDSLLNNLNEIFQRTTLLNILQNAQTQSPFRSELGGDGPLFSIQGGENGQLLLSFTNAQTATSFPAVGWEAVSRFDNLNQLALTIHNTVVASSTVGLAIDNMRTFYNLGTSPSLFSVIAENGATFTVESLTTLLAELVIPNLGQVTVSGASVNIPVIGLAFLPANIARDHAGNVQAHNDLVAAVDSIQLANIAGFLNLHATIVTDGSATQQVFFQPSVRTPGELGYYNDLLGARIINGTVQMPDGLTHPLDIAQIIATPELVSQFFHDAVR